MGGPLYVYAKYSDVRKEALINCINVHDQQTLNYSWNITGDMKAVIGCVVLVLCAVVAGAGFIAFRAEAGTSGFVPPPPVTFRIDPARSKFVVHAHRGGLAWFKGHDHYDAVRRFSGEASLSLDALNPASLVMNVDASSLEETGENFTEPQRKIINREIREIVLESDKYPEITFRSTGVTGKLKNGAFQIEITGNMTLHGVTRPVRIPATVTVSANDMHARGSFDLKRSDFNIKTTSAFHGWVRVKDRLTFDFDIVAVKG